MSNQQQPRKRIYWGNITPKLPELNLSQIQVNSYHWFLDQGIKLALQDLGPITDFTGDSFQLEFGDHTFGQPTHTPEECLKKGLTYAAPLRVNTILTNLETKTSKTQEVFLGDIPQITTYGTFIINGVERVVVNQLVRSPGVFFNSSLDTNTGRQLSSAEIRPIRGSWLEFNIHKNDYITVRIDRSRKLSAATFLRAIGFSSSEEISSLFKDVDTDKDHPYIAASLLKDATASTDEALLDFYQKIRPGEPAVLDNAKELLYQMFFDPRRYDLGLVGRYKINKRLSLDTPITDEHTTLTKEDIVATLRYLINLQNGHGKVDDIDHLANRRVRQIGELLYQGPFRIGLLRLERSIREKMSLAKKEEPPTAGSLVNPRPIIAAVSEFFRRNRLSAILDQVNPLAEIDNLRRLSVMGAGGVTRERASFSMRDIHASQYSRICPIRSPEGPNIGLVTYLALYTRINQYGFLEAPYFKVTPESKGGKTRMRITNEIVYLTADDEENHYITHADIARDGDYLANDWVPARYNGKFIEVDAQKIEYIDIIPRQVVGTSASLIPFLQHDDGTRALMGSHMQCQAVPLIKPDAPIIGTGMENPVAESMGWVIRARFDGEVISADSNTVTIKVDPKHIDDLKKLAQLNQSESITIKDDVETYHLKTFYRTSQSTAYTQRPLVRPGEQVKKGQIIIDGPASQNGELALGQNLVIAYANFEGLGYEDAIVVSDRLIKEDLLSSVHINEYEAQVMETKLGPEELTRDIPNVSEQDLKNLTEDGIVAIGSNVGPNDILVGKIAPKGETELTAEERLLRAIFGEKAREVRDTSLKMPHGESGTVIDVQILDRDTGDELDPGVIKQIKVKVAQLRKITVGDKVAGRHGNKGVISKVVPVADMPTLPDGTPVDIIISFLSVLARMNLGQLMEAQLGWAADKLNQNIAVPVFEKIPEDKIISLMNQAGLPVDGKIRLTDGRTGLPFEEDTAVGIGYILKLVHMVEDKTHARSTGPYSLVTQQPLGGKAQMGGQRLGEMEVWALEAHKAAHTLQEMLTIKSDDVVGRSRAFEAIVKGTDIPEATLPESFKVLVKELNSLGLSIIPTNPITRPSQDDSDISDKTQEETISDSESVPSHVSANATPEDQSDDSNDQSDQPTKSDDQAPVEEPPTQENQQ